jgi:hypothetical protein
MAAMGLRRIDVSGHLVGPAGWTLRFLLARPRDRRRGMSALQSELKRAFADAVHALSADPTSENVFRYLQASRDLERRYELESEQAAVAA